MRLAGSARRARPPPRPPHLSPAPLLPPLTSPLTFLAGPGERRSRGGGGVAARWGGGQRALPSTSSTACAPGGRGAPSVHLPGQARSRHALLRPARPRRAAPRPEPARPAGRPPAGTDAERAAQPAGRSPGEDVKPPSCPAPWRRPPRRLRRYGRYEVAPCLGKHGVGRARSARAPRRSALLSRGRAGPLPSAALVPAAAPDVRRPLWPPDHR